MQTIPKAELSAVAWVADWIKQKAGATVDVYTDSQYVVDLWAEQRRRRTFDRAACNQDPARNLWQVHGLRIYKVNAHNERQAAFSTDKFLRWTSAGNGAAYSAAKAARGLELPLLLQLSDTIAEHHYFQLDCMLSSAAI